MAGPGHLSPARAEIRTGGGKSRNNSASIKTWRRISGSDASPKKKKRGDADEAVQSPGASADAC